MSEKTPLVSVVMPAFNAAELIGPTLESVISQSFGDWELLVVDDCSKDSTREVVQAWADKDSRIKLITLPSNFGGPAGPRNEGVRLARGQYVAFLDSDDIWHPEKLRLQLQVLQEQGGDFACSRMRDFVKESEIEFCAVSDLRLQSVKFFQQSIRTRIPTSSVIVSRAVLLQFPFNEQREYRAVEDYHCWLRILQAGHVAIKLNIPLLHYRKVEGQISGSKVEMAKKVFMVHREYPGRSIFSALIMTVGHVVGALYVRLIKKEL